MAHDFTPADAIAEQAALWAVRTGDAAFAGWEEFTRWLEADPAHAAAYDRVMAAVDGVAAADLPPRAEPVEEAGNVVPLQVTRRRWIGGALAACVAGGLAVGLWQMRAPPSELYQTAPGEMREVALADGSSIVLAGGTRLAVAQGARHVTLEAGQALFTVHHDEAHPFTVTAGEDTLLDVGTVFDVRRGEGSLTVAVAEGAVVFNPDREKVRIDPGQRLTSRSGKVELGESPAAQVGEWREGRITFRDASLADVAADLSRASGVAFSAAPGAAGRVSGSVLVEPLRRDPGALGPLLGVRIAKTDKGWSIEP